MSSHYIRPGYVRQPTLDGYGEQWTPARIVYNGLGEPVGAFPALAALLPLAAKAIGAIAPVAAKAASAILPMVGKATSAVLPALQSALPMLAQQGLPSVPGLIPSGGLPSLSLIPPIPGIVPAVTPMVPVAPAMTPLSPAVVPQSLPALQAGRRLRRRRRFVRVMRDRGTGAVRTVRPIVSMPVPPASPTITASQVTVRPPPPTATESSGGVGDYGSAYGGFGGCGYYGPTY